MPPEPPENTPEPTEPPAVAPAGPSGDDLAKLKSQAEYGDAFREGLRELAKTDKDLATEILEALAGNESHRLSLASDTPSEPAAVEGASDDAGDFNPQAFKAELLGEMKSMLASTVSSALRDEVVPLKEQNAREEIQRELTAAKKHFGEEGFDPRLAAYREALKTKPYLDAMPVVEGMKSLFYDEDLEKTRTAARSAITTRVSSALRRTGLPPSSASPQARDKEGEGAERTMSIRDVAREAVLKQESEALTRL